MYLERERERLKQGETRDRERQRLGQRQSASFLEEYMSIKNDFLITLRAMPYQYSEGERSSGKGEGGGGRSLGAQLPVRTRRGGEALF